MGERSAAWSNRHHPENNCMNLLGFLRARIFSVSFRGRIACLIASVILGIVRCQASAQAQRDYQSYGTPVTAVSADPAIAGALAQISETRIHQTIEKLVSFGTRSTLSSMETDLPHGTGVTAAADWIFGQFEEISKECGGCLEVKRDTFTNPAAERIPRPTTITNVYAILRGSAASATGAGHPFGRMYLVTGHYDSRNTDILDDHGDAPGA